MIFSKNWILQACYFSSTTRNVNKVYLYLRRAKLIDAIRLCLYSNASERSLLNILTTSQLDSFVVANALRSAPSTVSAMSLVECLKQIEDFAHSWHTIHALAKVLARSGQRGKLGALIDAINGGKFVNVASVSFMDRMRWYADAGDLSKVTGIWHEWRRTMDKQHPCTESYNVVMKLYVERGMDTEALTVFGMIIEEGALPNSRTYTIVIQHLVSLGKLDSAMEVFRILPLMRIRRTLKQYSLLVEAFTGADRLDVVKSLLHEMQVDGILPGRAMLSSLQHMKAAGFTDESEELIKELMPDPNIKRISYSMARPDSDVDDNEDEDATSLRGGHQDDVQLKAWLDPAALASALQHWGSEEVSALEEANFTWTSRLVCKLIRSFKSPEIAWQFFSWVACQPQFVHDIYTISRMITKLARHGCVQLVDELLFKIKREGMKLSFSTIKLIIDFYGFSRHGDAALNIFRNVKTICGPLSKSSQLIFYSSLLRTLAKCEMNAEALDILEEMMLLGIFPDIQTFSGLMHHYALQGDIKTVQRLFAMVRQCDLEPDAYMFKILICAYCKCERASLGLRMFEDMKNSRLMPDAATKELLVKSLWKEGKLREAAQVEEISEEIGDNIQLVLPGNLYTDDGILVLPTVADPPPKLDSKKNLPAGFHDRIYALLSISECCQVTIPLGKQDDSPISVSFIASHGTDKFLLDTVVDMYSSLQEEFSISSSLTLPYSNGNMDAAELLKEKGNAAYKGKQWNKAVSYYTEAIKLNETFATYYCNRAAAYLELGCFQQAEEDCSTAISLDKKNVKAYLRRGTARESLFFYKEALQDFKNALVLEPQNKVASQAAKRLLKRNN